MKETSVHVMASWSAATASRLMRTAAITAALLTGIVSAARAQAPESNAPVASAYLYIEPYQTRLEALFGAEMFFEWVGEKIDLGAPLNPQAQQAVTAKLAPKVEGWSSLRDSGSVVKGRLASVSFVKGKPGQTEPMKEDESIVPKDCMIGLMWEFPTSPSPQTIEAQWWQWNTPVSSLPVKVFFGALSESQEATRALPFVKWQNDGRLPPPKPLAEVPALPPVTYIPIPLASIIWLAIGLCYYVLRDRTGRKPRGGWLGMIIAWLFVAAILLPMAVLRVRNPMDQKAAPVQTPQDATRIASPLLRNIYRAFDYQTESQIYDSLARSVEGEFLRKLYLDTTQALAIEGREGTRVRVSDVDVQIDKVIPGNGLAFTAEGQWTALGTVGHWGHTHTRVNRYNARVTIEPVGIEWKITGIDVQELRRL